MMSKAGQIFPKVPFFTRNQKPPGAFGLECLQAKSKIIFKKYNPNVMAERWNFKDSLKNDRDMAV